MHAQVLTSCNSTKEELVEEFCAATCTAPSEDGVHAFTVASAATMLEGVDLAAASAAGVSCPSTDSNAGVGHEHSSESEGNGGQPAGALFEASLPAFKLIDWVRTYPTFRYGGIEGTRVCTVVFCRRP